MSEFTLPANSKVGKGKHWPAPKDVARVKSFRIYRWDPDKKANPTLDVFEIDLDHCAARWFSMRSSRSMTRLIRRCHFVAPAVRACAVLAR